MSWLWIVGAVIVLFVFYSLLGLFSKRVREFQLKSTRTDTHPLALSNQAAIASNMGRHEEALDFSDRAIQVDANCKEAWYNRGVSLMHLGKPQEAEQAYRRAIEIDKGLWLAWHNLAAVLQSMGKNREADECMREAVRLRTASREPTITMGR